MAGKDKTNSKNTGEQESKQLGLFGRIGNEIKGWHKDFFDTLKYSPNPEKIVQLHCNSNEERQEILQNKRYLDGNNFRLQIGKMQEDGGTLYNDTTLSIGIEYMINHTKIGEQSVIQIWSDVGENLQQGSEEGVLSALQEKQKLEKFIEKKFGKKGKSFVKVEIGSEKYPEVFNALSKGRQGIIPDKEPNIENIVPFNSPLQIIQYLAYNASNDESLMQLFYNTKPNKYLGEDLKYGRKPGDSDADFYGIVEVGLRLYEVLNGISIQGGLGRQRVYDKIISLIINGKDTIKGKKDFDCDYKLFLKDFPKLQQLHEICKNHYPNTKFNQLYIELSGGENGGLRETEKKLEKKSKLRSKLKSRGYGALIAAVLSSTTGYITNEIIERKNEEKQEKFEEERINMWRHYNDSRTIKKLGDSASIGDVREIERAEEYFQEQANVLMAEYNISQLNQLQYCGDLILINNDIVDMYRDAFYVQLHKNHQNLSLLSKLNIEELTQEEWDQLFGYLTADQFMEEYGGKIIDKYHIPYQKPYEHFMQYQDVMKNTLKYGDQIDISKYKTKEMPTKYELSYFIKCDYSQKSTKPNGWFRLKIVRVYLDNGESVDLFLAEKNQYNWMLGENLDYSLKNGFDCMKDLSENYGYVIE